MAVDPARPVVTAAEYGWAERVADHCVATVLEQARRFVADSPHEALSKRVLEIIRRAGATTAGGWVDGHTLAERVRFVTRKVRQEVVAELVEGEPDREHRHQAAAPGAGGARVRGTLFVTSVDGFLKVCEQVQ